jgi:hypothetical protein
VVFFKWENKTETEKMSTDILASDLKSRLTLKTKTVGADKIRRAKENNEDIAVLSLFLPPSMAAAEEENRRFICALLDDCRLGDCRKTVPGIFRVPKPAQPGSYASLSFGSLIISLKMISSLYYCLPFNRTHRQKENNENEIIIKIIIRKHMDSNICRQNEKI